MTKQINVTLTLDELVAVQVALDNELQRIKEIRAVYEEDPEEYTGGLKWCSDRIGQLDALCRKFLAAH